MQIGSIGFPEDQRVKLEKIFKLSKQTRYTLVDPDFDNLPDLMLVFGFVRWLAARGRPAHRHQRSRARFGVAFGVCTVYSQRGWRSMSLFPCLV